MTRRFLSSAVLTATAAALAPATASACTLCHSPTATIVREALSGPDFLPNAAALALVFPAIAAAAMLARRLAP